MNVTITNEGAGVVPLVQGTSGTGEALAMIDAGALYAIADDAVTVVSVGDNPSFMDEVKESLANIADVLERLAFWRANRPQPLEADTSVSIEIANAGPNPLRVLLDSNTNEVFVSGGETMGVSASRYVEIREQGV